MLLDLVHCKAEGFKSLTRVLFEYSIFREFLVEIESLGFVISDSPSSKSTPYAVIGGRSNARWWLVPLTNRHVTTSGLALFQPILPSARVIKNTASMLSALGLSRFWAKNVVHISCPTAFADLFKRAELHYAFFTGTDSPHRKAAVQIMDRAGRILGFAKISRNPSVWPLLTNEAQTLDRLHDLDLQSALLPEVLFSGEINGAEVLVTDSLKTLVSKTVVSLESAHVDFLRELMEKTTVDGDSAQVSPVDDLVRDFSLVAENLPVAWQCRLEKAINIVVRHERNLRARSLSHGDFTPWNTFFVDSRLYVFDWEYASRSFPVGYDLVHFLFSLPSVSNPSVDIVVSRVRKKLRGSGFGQGTANEDVHLLGYFCAHSAFYLSRAIKAGGDVSSWGGQKQAAELIDTLLLRI